MNRHSALRTYGGAVSALGLALSFVAVLCVCVPGIPLGLMAAVHTPGDDFGTPMDLLIMLFGVLTIIGSYAAMGIGFFGGLLTLTGLPMLFLGWYTEQRLSMVREDREAG